MAMRRPRIKAAANILSVKRKPKTTAVDAKTPAGNIAEVDAANFQDTSQTSDESQQSRDDCAEETSAATELNEQRADCIENSAPEKATTHSPNAESSATEQQTASFTRRPRIRAAANVVASAKRRSKPGLGGKPQSDAKDETPNSLPDKIEEKSLKVGPTEVKAPSSKLTATTDLNTDKIPRENETKEINEKLLEPPSSSNNSVDSKQKPPINDGASFKCPSNIEYSGLHNTNVTAMPTTSTEELTPSEYDGVLQSDMQKSLLGPPMSPLSPSKVLSRQRIRATPHFGQRRNSFVGSSPSPHTGDDASPSDYHHPSSPYHHQRRDRHYSGPHTPFSTLASPAMSAGGGSGHYGSPHKYAPLIPSGRIRTESSCSTFSDFVGGHKPKKQEEITARRRDFEARFTNGVPEKSTIKMSDLIYYNPVTNPMEAKPKMQIKSELKSSTSMEYLDAQEDLKEEKPDLDTAMPVPQLKLNAQGELILDDTSLEIETTAEQEARKILAKSSLIYLDENTGMNGFYKRQKRTKDWGPDETIKFYRCLQTLGSDFSMMCQLFPKRTRRDIKLKFKKEERCNEALINKALLCPKQFNIDDLTKQLEHEESEREAALKRWKEIKAANPKYVKAMKPKVNSSTASRVLSRGEHIYDNENIINTKLGKRSLSAVRRVKKPKTESESVKVLNSGKEIELIDQPLEVKKPSRKRKIASAIGEKLEKDVPSKQRKESTGLTEMDDAEIVKDLGELLDMEEDFSSVVAMNSPKKVIHENVELPESLVATQIQEPENISPTEITDDAEIVKDLGELLDMEEDFSSVVAMNSPKKVIHENVESPDSLVATQIQEPENISPTEITANPSSSITTIVPAHLPSIPHKGPTEAVSVSLTDFIVQKPVTTGSLTPAPTAITDSLSSIVNAVPTPTTTSPEIVDTPMQQTAVEVVTNTTPLALTPITTSVTTSTASLEQTPTTTEVRENTSSPANTPHWTTLSRSMSPELFPAVTSSPPSSPLMETADTENIQRTETTSRRTSQSEEILLDDIIEPDHSSSASLLNDLKDQNTQDEVKTQDAETSAEAPSTSAKVATTPTPNVHYDIDGIVSGIVKGTLVLVSSIQPGSEEMVNEVYVQDVETEELSENPLPLSADLIDQIVQICMSDCEDDDNDEA